MEFTKDIFRLNPSKGKVKRMTNLKPPSSRDVYFRAKQDEIFRQYESARIFLNEIETDDWDHWFQLDDPKHNDIFVILFKERMFEAALMFYNIIVDLSWSLCYVSIEYVLKEKALEKGYIDVISVDKAEEILRDIEGDVYDPIKLFRKLKEIPAEFSEPISIITEFYTRFKDSDIRDLYNFIKHRGKPRYKEVEIYSPKWMKFTIKDVDCPCDIRDVQRSISLYDYIDKLFRFDEEILYPYIKQLFDTLEQAINPSSLVF